MDQREPAEEPTADEQAREMAERHRRAVEAGEIPGENEAMKDKWWVKGERVEDTSDDGES